MLFNKLKQKTNELKTLKIFNKIMHRTNGSKCFPLQDGRKLGFGGMHGIPMVASSPVRHESPIGMTPLEVQAYQPPWKALSDFALHTDLERLDPNTPSFHHLVSQVSFI